MDLISRKERNMNKLKMHSPDLIQENIARIRELFPGCVTEAKDKDGQVKLAVDFDQLRQELSESVVEGPQERYHLNWPGKRQALLAANEPIDKTLRPYREESVDFDTTKNLFIEGDNLDALKLLQETYLGKVKMIYIDPPYNTGDDFIYKDNFAEKTEEYLKRSNQKDEKGNRFVANTETNGRFHSDWLSMIYPRLKLARNLLSDDGVIFISIGVEEFHNLKKIMDEIFGEPNFVEVFSWVKTSTPPSLSPKSRKTNEYILCYEKSKNLLKYKGEDLDGGDQPLLNTGNSIRTLSFPKDKVLFSFLDNGVLQAGKQDRVSLLTDLSVVNGYATEDFSLSGEFKWTQEKLNEEIKNGTIFIIKSDKLSIRFIRSEEGFNRPTNFIKEKYTSPVIDKKTCAVGTNENASSELSSLMGGDVFSYPKPVTLVEYLINFTVEDDDVVMDFFAGSGTTAEAVYKYSQKNTKRVNFILAQLPENLDEMLVKTKDKESLKKIKNGIAMLDNFKKPHLLSELTKIRLRRVVDRLNSNNLYRQDLGFRVLKVDSSNMADVYYKPDEVKQDLVSDYIDNVKPDRKPEDLLFQVMLDWGLELSLSIRKENLHGKDVFFVNEPSYDLVACFDTGVGEDLVKKLAGYKPQRVVFRDTGFVSDSVKINVEQIFKQMAPDTEVKVI
jgi:adenine-specific DNA-methyltransferase